MSTKAEEVKRLLHQLANCHQACIGYFELGEYAKAKTLAMECKAEWSQLIQKLTELEEDN